MVLVGADALSDILLRAEFREPVQSHRTLAEYVWPWVKEQTAQGRELVAANYVEQVEVAEAA